MEMLVCNVSVAIIQNRATLKAQTSHAATQSRLINGADFNCDQHWLPQGIQFCGISVNRLIWFCKRFNLKNSSRHNQFLTFADFSVSVRKKRLVPVLPGPEELVPASSSDEGL